MVMSMTRPRRSFGLPCKLVDRDAYDWLTDDYMAKVREAGNKRKKILSFTYQRRGGGPIDGRARPKAPDCACLVCQPDVRARRTSAMHAGLELTVRS